MSTATVPETPEKQARKRRNQFATSTDSVDVPWSPQIAEEEKQRQAFRLAMRRAFLVRPRNRVEAIERAEKVMTVIHAWCLSNSSKILACWVVNRRDHIEVLIFELLREFEEEFSRQVSELGIELAQLGISSSVTLAPVDHETGEKVGDRDFVHGDPCARLGV